MRALFPFLFSVVCANAAIACEVIPVCATYLPTGRDYEVTAQIYDGDELQERTGDHFGYSGYKTYVVIFWRDSEASVIAMDFSHGPTAIGSRGEDQGGRPWEISTSTVMCGY